MDNATMMYIVIGLVAIFFIVLLVFSAKTWRVLHLISALLVFIAAAFFVWYSAATLQTHAAWRDALNKLEAKIAAADRRIELLRDGSAEEDSLEDSVRYYDGALARVLLDRPSVWRSCTPQISGNNIVLTIPAVAAAPAAAAADADPDADPDAAEPAADAEDPAAPPPAARHSIEPNLIVFGFLEGESELSGDLSGHVVPQLYLGEFKVLSRTDTQITVQPTLRLTRLQRDNLAGGTWVLYDGMPTDSRHAFAGLSEEDLKVLFPHDQLMLSTADYNARISELVRFFAGLDPANFPDANIPADAAAMARMVPIATVQMDDAGYQSLIDQYLRDGETFDDARDPPGRVWKRVSFKIPTSVQVDAVLQDLNALDGSNDFEARPAVAIRRDTGEVLIGDQALIESKAGDQNLGQVQLGISVRDPLKLKTDWEIAELWDSDRSPPQLRPLAQLAPDEKEAVREAKSVEFEIDEQAVVDSTTAAFLKQHGIAEEVESVFVRQLRDYKTYFRDSNQQELTFQDNARVILQDTVTLVAAGQRAKEQETFRADEIAKLQRDRQGFLQEQAAITGVLAKMDSHRGTLNRRLSQLYNNNVNLAQRIHRLQLQQAAAIQRRLQESPTAPPAPAASPTVAAP